MEDNTYKRAFRRFRIGRSISPCGFDKPEWLPAVWLCFGFMATAACGDVPAPQKNPAGCGGNRNLAEVVEVISRNIGGYSGGLGYGSTFAVQELEGCHISIRERHHADGINSEARYGFSFSSLNERSVVLNHGGHYVSVFSTFKGSIVDESRTGSEPEITLAGGHDPSAMVFPRVKMIRNLLIPFDDAEVAGETAAAFQCAIKLCKPAEPSRAAR